MTMSGWMPMRRSSWTECWVGLVFSSPAWPRNGHEREVHEHAAVAPWSTWNWRSASRNGSDSMSPTVPPISVITMSTSSASATQPDAVLDLVGDVRDHLDGAAEVVAAALAPDHRVVDRAGGGVRGAGGVHVGEALVVAEVEVGLGAVLGDEHLAVLERAHRARVDVDVRVELLDRHRQAARDQQLPDRGGGDALAESGDDAAGDEDEAGLRAASGHSGSGSSSVLHRAAADDRAQAAASSSSACLRARRRRTASAPSIRHSSSTTPSPVELPRRSSSAVSSAGRLLDPEVAARPARRSAAGG